MGVDARVWIILGMGILIISIIISITLIELTYQTDEDE